MIFYLEAFYVLTADVDDEVYLGAEVSGSLEVSDCFNDAVVDRETCLYEVLAVACNSRAFYGDIGVHSLVYLFDLVEGLTLIRAVVVIEYTSVVGYEHKFCSSRACVDTEICVALVCTYITVSEVEFLVSVDESIIFSLGAEKRLSGDDII